MMTTANVTEEFEVTLLKDVNTTLSWTVTAETPEQALEIAMSRQNASTGTYSVWGPQDPNGMPLLEHS